MFKRQSLLVAFFMVAMSQCFALTDAVVTGDNLNVRKSPGGEVVDKLKRDTSVKIVRDTNGWAQVVYLKNNSEDTSFGWVSSKFLDLQFVAQSTHCTHTDSGDESCISMMAPELQCQKTAGELGYSECSVKIRYEVKETAQIEADRHVLCSAALASKHVSTDQWTMLVDESAQNLERGKSRRVVLLTFDFGDETAVTDIRIEKSQCEIKDGLVTSELVAN